MSNTNICSLTYNSKTDQSISENTFLPVWLDGMYSSYNLNKNGRILDVSVSSLKNNENIIQIVSSPRINLLCVLSNFYFIKEDIYAVNKYCIEMLNSFNMVSYIYDEKEFIKIKSGQIFEFLSVIILLVAIILNLMKNFYQTSIKTRIVIPVVSMFVEFPNFAIVLTTFFM